MTCGVGPEGSGLAARIGGLTMASCVLCYNNPNRLVPISARLRIGPEQDAKALEVVRKPWR
jgi:hypothetical protein